MVFWSNTNFQTAVHENSHMAAALNFGAIPVAITIHARGGLAEWRWIDRAPTPRELIIIASAGAIGERELLGRYEPIADTSDEDVIEKLRVGLTADEINRCRAVAGGIVRIRKQWILTNARIMSENGRYLL